MKKTGLVLVILTIAMSSFAQSDESYEEILGHMFEVSGKIESMRESVDQMILMVTQVDTVNESDVWQTLRTDINATMIPELTAMMTPVYQKYLTQSDLEAIIEFYSSPVGKKYAASQPKITKDAWKVGEEWGEKVADRVMNKSKND